MDQSSNREDYTEDIKEEYEDIRVDHYDTLRVSIRVDHCCYLHVRYMKTYV